MARLTDVQRGTLGTFWNLAVDFAQAGLTTTELTEAANGIAAQAGQSLSFAENTALATLYGYARRMANAAGALGAAVPADVIGPDLMATPPWARDEQTMLTTPIWHVTFNFTYLDQAGNQVTDYKTSVFEMTMPETVGELNAAVLDDAQQMADKYGVRLLSVNLHSILAV